jgi:ABC-type glycerol-3-phosphate transport system substrate-binding protein
MTERDRRVRGISRRAWLGGGAAGSVALLAACGGPGAGQQPAAAPQQDLKGTTIDFWAWNGPAHPETLAVQHLMEDFNTKNTAGIKVNFSAPSTGGQTTYEKYVTALTGGVPPDAAIGQHFYMSDLFRQGGLVDVESELKANADWKKAKSGLSPEILTGGFTWTGKVYGVPYYSSHFAMYYQPELLKRAGLAAPPPKAWTWDQFVDYQKKAATPPDVTGYDDQFSYSRAGMLVLNNGHRFMSADGTKFSYNSPEAVEAIDFQLNLVRQGLMRGHDGSASGGYSEKLPLGQVVFQFGVAARVLTYRKDGTQFGTTYFPIGKSSKDKKSVTHGEAYGVSVFKNKDARKQQAALVAALWGTRPEMGLLIAREAGAPPSYKYTVEDPAFQAEFKKDAETWPFYDLIPGFIPMPNFPGFGDVRTTGDKMIPDIWSGKGTTKQVLDEYTRLAQQRLDEVLR